MKMRIEFAIILLSACSWAGAQVVPAATGPGGPLVSGNLSYSLRYSQTALLYGSNQVTGGNQVTSIASANVEYADSNERLPFSLNYGGGYMSSISGPSLGTGVFQHLVVSQGLVEPRWNVTVRDDVSYTPEAPTTGFSGVPGTGEPISGSGVPSSSSESILTLNTRTLSNTASATVGYMLDYATTMDVGGGYELLNFPDGNGLDSNGADGSVGVSRRYSARTSISGQYLYSHFSFDAAPYSGGAAGSFDTSSVSFEYKHNWSRQFTTDVTIGPQWTSGSDNALVPPTKGVMVRASVNYQFRNESASVSYNRGISGMIGYMPSGTIDSVNGNLSRTFERTLTVGATGTYFRTVPLGNVGTATDAWFSGAQISQRLGRYLNARASYTAVDQSSGLSGSTPQANVLNQLYQVISFGISYSPREPRVSQ